jgi:hypothetical protein
MREGGVRNSWCPSGVIRSFLLFSSGLLVSLPYYAAVVEVVFARSPRGDSKVNHIACTRCVVMLECIHAASVGISILLAWCIIAIRRKPWLHWFFPRGATHFAAGFYQGLALNRLLLSLKEDDGEEERPAEGLSLSERYLCYAFAISVWNTLVVSLCALKIGQEEAGQRKINRQRRPCWIVVFSRRSLHDDETEAADELDELETAYSPMPAALVNGQRRGCRNEEGIFY